MSGEAVVASPKPNGWVFALGFCQTVASAALFMGWLDIGSDARLPMIVCGLAAVALWMSSGLFLSIAASYGIAQRPEGDW